MRQREREREITILERSEDLMAEGRSTWKSRRSGHQTGIQRAIPISSLGVYTTPTMRRHSRTEALPYQGGVPTDLRVSQEVQLKVCTSSISSYQELKFQPMTHWGTVFQNSVWSQNQSDIWEITNTFQILTSWTTELNLSIQFHMGLFALRSTFLITLSLNGIILKQNKSIFLTWKAVSESLRKDMRCDHTQQSYTKYVFVLCALEWKLLESRNWSFWRSCTELNIKMLGKYLILIVFPSKLSDISFSPSVYNSLGAFR